MHKTKNVWLDRFRGLEDQDEIMRRAMIPGQVIDNIEEIPNFRIQDEVRRALSNFYLPSPTDIRILMHLIEQMMAHCWRRYADHHTYLSELYRPYSDFESEFMSPHCLTGPAGVGKSALINALRRVLPADSSVDLGPAHPKADLTAHWHIEVRDRTSLAQMLLPFVQKEFGSSRRVLSSELSRVCAKFAYRNGICLLLLDELQFLTHSTVASTLITKTLYQLAYIGIPLVFVANYSLIHLLKSRQEQDKQRLLTSPLILTPASPESSHWTEYLAEVKNILGKSFLIDVEQEAGSIYHFTAGLKRFVIQLIATAYDNVWRQGRKQVRIEDIANAYDGVAFATNREQVKQMLLPRPSVSTKAYECPFPLPPDESVTLDAVRKQVREKALTYKVQQEVMTPEERKVLKLNKVVLSKPVHTQSENTRKSARRKSDLFEELLETNIRRHGENNLYKRTKPGAE